MRAGISYAFPFYTMAKNRTVALLGTGAGVSHALCLVGRDAVRVRTDGEEKGNERRRNTQAPRAIAAIRDVRDGLHI